MTQAAAARYSPSPNSDAHREKYPAEPQTSLDICLDASVGRCGSVALVLIFALGPVDASHSAREQALAELVDLHVATLASANPVDVISTDRHTVKPWFQGKLPFTFNLPELQNSSFKLVGGRGHVF